MASPGSGDVATCVTKQFAIASCPASQMALELLCARSLSPQTATLPALDGPGSREQLVLLALGLLSQELDRALSPLCPSLSPST